MQIEQRYACKSNCFNTNKSIEVKGLMLHSVGCNQSRASVFIGQWNKPGVDVCAHAIIDGLTDGLVIQTLPWEHRGWHGGGTSNNTHIGVEMAEPDCIEYTKGATFKTKDKKRAIEIAQRTYNTAVELFAYLSYKYALDPLKKGVIVSHSEGYKLGIASGHADPEHLWNQLGLSITMDKFRSDVNKLLYSIYYKNKKMEDKVDNLLSEKKSDEAIAKEVLIGKYGCGNERKEKLEHMGYNYEAVQKIVNSMVNGTYVEKVVESNKEIVQNKEIVPYLIRVTGQTNIYKDEKANEVVGVAKPGVYTIVEEKCGLGLLKSKWGWIKLGEVKKIAG